VEELINLISWLWAFDFTQKFLLPMSAFVIFAVLCAFDKTHPLRIEFAFDVLVAGLIVSISIYLVSLLNLPWYIPAVCTVIGLFYLFRWSLRASKPSDEASPYLIRKPWLSSAFDAYERQDYAEALKQFKGQANRGDPVAQNNLGVMYEAGVGEERNDKLAERYYRLAAVSGLAEAQLNLATILAADLMVETRSFMGKQSDPKERSRLLIESYMWLWLSAAQNHRPAKKGLRKIKKHMLPEEIGEAKGLAIKWCPDFSFTEEKEAE
jgi:hypothetical protein